MSSVVGLGARIGAILRAPFDFLLVLGINFRARLWGFLFPKELYRPLGPNELRLLTIHRALTSRRDELVRVTLHHESLEHTPEYIKWEETADPELRLQKKTKAWFAEAKAQKAAGMPYPSRYTWGDYIALSYCWGDGVRSHRIIMNGQIVAVTETLESALCSVRGEWGTLRLWADALCINQNDIAERGREVRRMRKIYGNPAGVFVHLGPEADNSTLAMQLIDKMTTSLRDGVDLAQNVLQTAVEIQEGRPDSSGDGIIAIYLLLCRPYWSRMWIIQELAMGDEQIVVGCGNQGLSLSDIRQTLKFIVLNQASLNAIIPHEIISKHAKAYQSTIQILWSASRLRELALAPVDRDFTFSELCHPILRLSQYAAASDSRDKVYGAMSLMPTSLASRVDKQDDNYKLTTQEVFANFTKSVIEVTNDLDVIWNVNPQQKTLSVLDLPTWSPDWTLRPGRSAGTGSSQEWFFGEDKRYATFDKFYNLPTTWLRDPSRADSGRVPRYHFSDDERTLHCEGFEIATVGGMACEIEVWNRISSEPERMVQGEPIDSPYGSDEATTQALIRTMLLDASGSLSGNSIVFKLPWFGEDSNALSEYGPEVTVMFDEMMKKGWNLRFLGGGLSTFDEFRHQVSQFVVGKRRFRDYFPTEVTHCPPNASLLEFSIIVSNMVGRRLMVTTTGHVGLAPATVVPRDKVYVLIGSTMPVILRPVGGNFEVVGECFIDGFMKGEAVVALDAGDYQLREISLC